MCQSTKTLLEIYRYTEQNQIHKVHNDYFHRTNDRHGYGSDILRSDYVNSALSILSFHFLTRLLLYKGRERERELDFNASFPFR